MHSSAQAGVFARCSSGIAEAVAVAASAATMMENFMAEIGCTGGDGESEAGER